MIGAGAAGLATARHLTSELDVFDVRVTRSSKLLESAKPTLPCEQRLHFRCVSWRAKSSYFHTPAHTAKM